MQKTIGTYEAKTRFSEVIREVSAGERYIVTRNGEKVAEIIPYKKHPRRKRGSMKGYFSNMSDDFNEPLEDFAEYQ